jgi:hypothetical protein
MGKEKFYIEYPKIFNTLNQKILRHFSYTDRWNCRNLQDPYNKTAAAEAKIYARMCNVS